MRYIDNIHLIFPDNWQDRAIEAKRKVESGEKQINELSDVWRELKDNLAQLSFDKCWYCECKQERSDNAVDHFRPKNRVANTDPEHNGYTWLAFDYNNYRYSCTFCNSKRKNPDTNETEGKGDEFPLIDETKRAYREVDNIRLEKPILIDPCKINDVQLLDFTYQGLPCPKSNISDEKKERVLKSIKLYHLDHNLLVTKRNDLALEIYKKIDEINLFLEENPGLEPSPSMQSDLQRFMQPSSELSVFARRIIMGKREYSWIEDLICTA
ncbi:hypothetical protein ACH5BK_00930 [Arcobacter sp. YIC-80]|uniref:hypothetical protein n=1 Tax=Arcobacter sp. YIC-80 TaxID=3376683 RepID=UPI00384ECC50